MQYHAAQNRHFNYQSSDDVLISSDDSEVDLADIGVDSGSPAKIGNGGTGWHSDNDMEPEPNLSSGSEAANAHPSSNEPKLTYTFHEHINGEVELTILFNY